ncbi:hypothetical protein JTB14_000175 [Gonioctena quinquepunctata]|nr:hypothetical protein JTB14_000175 [Gonioctena quinquepunctata]
MKKINSTATPPSLEDLQLNGIEDIIYQKDAVIDVLEFSDSNTTDSNDIPQYPPNITTTPPNRLNFTTQGPSLEQKLTSDGLIFRVTKPISTVRPCSLDCGPGGGCSLENSEEAPTCLCPLGKSGERCDVGEWSL